MKRLLVLLLVLLAIVPTKAAPYGNFKVVGYATSWNTDLNAVQYDKLTHVIYAFLYPKSDGGIEPFNVAKLQTLVNLARANNVKVLVSFAGDSAFENMTANPTATMIFISTVSALCDQYQLDGIDIDWEYPDPGDSAQRYVNFMRLLGAKMHSQQRLFTAAVMPKGYYADAILSDVFPHVDWLNLMIYNDNWTNHSSYDFTVASLNYWQNRGLPVDKTVLGIPFYTYSDPNKTVMYRELVAANPWAPCSESMNYNGVTVNYNGFQGVRAKTKLAQDRGLAGVMIWHLGHDTADQTSLTRAIYAQLTGDSSGMLQCN